jgi:IclR family transcriptional regulator, acetate operon repressor
MSGGAVSPGTPDTNERPEVPGSGTQSAIRVADVLLLLAAAPDRLGVTEIARELGIAKAVVHRILQSLAARDLVAVDRAGRNYGLGPAAAALGARALRDLDLRRIAMPVLRRLQAQSGETTTVSALVGDARVYLAQIVSLQQIRMEVELGRPFPLHAGSSSKAILAVAAPDLRRHVLSGPLPRLTPETIVDADRLAEELDAIGRERVAVSRGERQDGAGSVAAPVFGLDGSVVGSISVCGPITRFDDATLERLKPLVRAAGDEISRALRH